MAERNIDQFVAKLGDPAIGKYNISHFKSSSRLL